MWDTKFEASSKGLLVLFAWCSGNYLAIEAGMRERGSSDRPNL